VVRIKYQEAAGLEVKRGRPSTGIKPEKEKLVQLYIQESWSIREIAQALGCKKDVVHYWLRKYGIQARSNASRSQLRNIPFEEIEKKIEELGIRGYARALGVAEGTVRHHLKVRNGGK
jgi:transposase-like protein